MLANGVLCCKTKTFWLSISLLFRHIAQNHAKPYCSRQLRHNAAQSTMLTIRVDEELENCNSQIFFSFIVSWVHCSAGWYLFVTKALSQCMFPRQLSTTGSYANTVWRLTKVLTSTDQPGQNSAYSRLLNTQTHQLILLVLCGIFNYRQTVNV